MFYVNQSSNHRVDSPIENFKSRLLADAQIHLERARIIFSCQTYDEETGGEKDKWAPTSHRPLVWLDVFVGGRNYANKLDNLLNPTLP